MSNNLVQASGMQLLKKGPVLELTAKSSHTQTASNRLGEANVADLGEDRRGLPVRAMNSSSICWQ
jgi:hypothetical protein